MKAKLDMRHVMHPDSVRAHMRHAIRLLGSQKAAAKRWGISPQYLHDVINGRRQPGKSVCDALGFERVVVYQPKGAGKY